MTTIALPADSIRRILLALGLPPHQWNVVGVEVTLDARGPSLVRVARVSGTSEVWEDYELVDGDGERFGSGWRLKRLVDTVLGRPTTYGQRVMLNLRVGHVPTVTVQTVATGDDIVAWCTGLETLTTAVPVVELTATGGQRCTVCYDPNCDLPGGKH